MQRVVHNMNQGAKRNVKVVNILKDGTICEDMSKAKVPKEKVQAVANIVERKRNEKHNY